MKRTTLLLLFFGAAVCGLAAWADSSWTPQALTRLLADARYLKLDGTNTPTAPIPTKTYATSGLPTSGTEGAICYDTTADTLKWWTGSTWGTASVTETDPLSIHKAGDTMTGTLYSQNILPSTANLYQLGSPTRMYSGLYVNEIMVPVMVGATIAIGDNGEGQRITFTPTTGVFQRDGHTVWDAGNITPPAISSGTSAPSSTPGKIGDLYVDTAAHKLYFAECSTSSSCWVAAN